MLPGCNITGVSLGTRPLPKRAITMGNCSPNTLFQPPTFPSQVCLPRNAYDITMGMLSGSCNITSPKRHKQSHSGYPSAQLPANLTSSTLCCPELQSPQLSVQQQGMIATTSGCLLDMVMSVTGPLSLNVEDNKSLAERITRMYTLMTMARAVSTRRQDTGSN